MSRRSLSDPIDGFETLFVIPDPADRPRTDMMRTKSA